MSSKVNLSISSSKLAELIHAGHLCAADFSCLDADSKQQVWQLCLWSCNRRVHCSKNCTENCGESTGTDKKMSTTLQPDVLLRVNDI